MTPKKTKKEFEKLLHEMIAEYAKILMLTHHTFTVEYGCNNKSSFMEFKFSYPYLNSKILYSDKALKCWQKGEDMLPYLLHELCHGLTDPFYSKAASRYVTKDEVEDERERLTDHICNIVLELTMNWERGYGI